MPLESMRPQTPEGGPLGRTRCPRRWAGSDCLGCRTETRRYKGRNTCLSSRLCSASCWLSPTRTLVWGPSHDWCTGEPPGTTAGQRWAGKPMGERTRPGWSAASTQGYCLFLSAVSVFLSGRSYLKASGTRHISFFFVYLLFLLFLFLFW